jgi:hypothetical protein
LSQALTEPPRDAPAAGDRFPWLRLRFAPDGPAEDVFAHLDDTRFNLLLIGQGPVAPSPSDLVTVHAIPAGPPNDRELASAGIAAPSFYLLRPDGHIGLAGTRFAPELLSRYLAERIGIKGAPAG